MKPVPRSDVEGAAPAVAPLLLGKLLVYGDCIGRIVEVEAYTSDEPAAHSYNGKTERNAVMFGPPGHLYCYLSYGVHICANVVTGPEGDGQAVLIRALAPVEGLESMRRRRGDRRPLTDGPGKLCQALGIELLHDGADLCGGGEPGLYDDGAPLSGEPVIGPRIGITKAVDLPWRWRSR
ncbi:MAG: DNA-3-methyladenine glycosylase [Acidimicrobiia bacterium]|nr:DNA-3-methyladenine glycosylase [Acidimicrobiia bacterium]